MMLLYLNSRFEAGLNFQDYACIDTAFDFFKEDQLYFEIPQVLLVGQISIIIVNSTTFSEVLSRHSVENTLLCSRNCKTTHASTHNFQ